MLDRVDGRPDDILSSIVARIQTEVSELSTPGSCYFSLNPARTLGPGGGEYVCVIAPQSGSFVDGAINGGATAMCTVETGFVARLYSTAQIDPAMRDGLFLTDASRGILQLATKLLAALVGFDPVIGGQRATRDPIAPVSFEIGRTDRAMGWMELRFKFAFDWSLT